MSRPPITSRVASEAAATTGLPRKVEVWMASPWLSPQARMPYIEGVRSEYEKVAAAHARSEHEKTRMPLERARKNAMKIDWAGYQPPRPTFTGTRVFRSYDVAELVPYIDWTPFFQTWDMKGRFPAILDDEKQGGAARQLWDDAQEMLARVIAERWFNPKAVIGFWPAGTVGDDIALFTGESRTEKLATFFTLRQQLLRRDGNPNLALSDFVAPADSGKGDYIGGFVVTAGAEEDKISKRFAQANDDYGSIMVKALADRLAEALAERMHERVRREFWGYARDEVLTEAQRLNEEYAGIRPAPGYPAQPDHTEKATLFALLEAERRIGVKLTESFAMWPGSSVSGLYLAHPKSYYFGVAKVERDQVEDYAARKSMDVREVERWLGPVLNYDPAGYVVAA